MVVRLPQVAVKSSPFRYPLMLMSDLHIGAAACEKEKIIEDLEWAKANDARVLINGDVFDLILPHDRRFVPEVIDPEIGLTAAIVNNAVDMATRMLAPYAKQIDAIGVGNHESSAIKWHGADVVSLLIERLATHKGAPIHHMGYTGCVVIPFRRRTGGGVNWSVYYHHGFGGNSPVTKGEIQFARLHERVGGFDALWMGHIHQRRVGEVWEENPPTYNDLMTRRRVCTIRTGAYSTKIEEQLKNGHYRPDWGREKGFSAQGRGGIKVALIYHIVQAKGRRTGGRAEIYTEAVI